MVGNQRLQTFAALCAGQSDAPTEEGREASGVGTQSGESQNPIASASPSSPTTQQSQPGQDVRRKTGIASVQNQQSAMQNMNQQQLQQAIARAAGLGGAVAPSLAAAQSVYMQGGLTTQQLNEAAMLQQYIQQAQRAFTTQQASQALSTNCNGNLRENQALMMAALAGGKANPFGQVTGAATELLQGSQQQVIPSASTSNLAAHAETSKASVGANIIGSPSVPTSMKPPPPPSQKSVQATLSTAGIPLLGQAPPKIAPMPGSEGLINNGGAAGSSVVSALDDKKQQKRAANRRSAQLSRKRKKQYIEELKEENDELRRKEQILRSIPDLIVVFDSSGKLGFVSPSVSRFIDMSPEELVGTSFWDRLCEGSVRLLKSAFMDALAAKKSNSDRCLLGSGVWDLRLVDKDSNYKLVSLNGVVHFSGEAPECVCCIRPLDQQPMQNLSKEIKKEPTACPVSSCDGSRSSDSSMRDALEIRANPNQSVISTDSGTNSGRRKKPRREDVRGGEVDSVRISDGDSVSGSGSEDGIASN